MPNSKNTPKMHVDEKPNELKQFEDLGRKLFAVPKEEADALEQEAKNKAKKRKKQSVPPPQKGSNIQKPPNHN